MEIAYKCKHLVNKRKFSGKACLINKNAFNKQMPVWKTTSQELKTPYTQQNINN